MRDMRSYLIIATATVVILSTSYSFPQSRGVQITVRDKQGNAVAFYEESHALLIGVSNYNNGWPPLSGVKKDVEEVKKILEQHGFNVVVVIDPDKRQLEDAFQDFIAKYGQKPENRLLFYFAGHGHTMKLAYGAQMGYLVPVDAPNPNFDPSGFVRLALSMQAIEVFAKNIQSKHALFVFDSCFSGSIFFATRAIPDHIAEKTGKPVRQFITSGSADQQVPDQSIFKSQFVAALQGEADTDGDGYVTGSELGQFLERTVTNYTKRAQTPQYGKIQDPLLDKGDFVFALPNKGGSKEPSPSSSHLPQITQDSASLELAFWESIKNSQRAEAFEEYLKKFPNGTFAGLAKIKMEELRKPPTTTQTAPPVLKPPEVLFQEQKVGQVQESQNSLIKTPASSPTVGSKKMTGVSQAENDTNKMVTSALLTMSAIPQIKRIEQSQSKMIPMSDGKKFRFASPVLIRAGNHDIEKVVLSQDGALLAAVSVDGIKIWRIDPFQQIWEINGEKRFSNDLLSFSSDDRYLAFGYDGSVNIFDLLQGKIIYQYKSKIRGGFFHPTESHILFLHEGTSVNIIDWVSKQEKGKIGFEVIVIKKEGPFEPTPFTYSTRSKQYAYFGLYYLEVKDSYQIVRCNLLTLLCDKSKIKLSEDSRSELFEVSPDDKYVGINKDFNYMDIYKITGWPWKLEKLSTLRHGNTIYGMKFLTSEIVVTGSVDRSVAIWDILKGKKLSTFTKPGVLSYVTSVDVDRAKGRIVIGALYGVVYFFNY